MPKYRSSKTGRYVSEHYGKRNPRTTEIVEQSAADRAREIREGLREQGRTFSDSTDTIRRDREGLE